MQYPVELYQLTVPANQSCRVSEPGGSSGLNQIRSQQPLAGWALGISTAVSHEVLKDTRAELGKN
jgi:hypothetical protein